MKFFTVIALAIAAVSQLAYAYILPPYAPNYGPFPPVYPGNYPYNYPIVAQPSPVVVEEVFVPPYNYQYPQSGPVVVEEVFYPNSGSEYLVAEETGNYSPNSVANAHNVVNFGQQPQYVQAVEPAVAYSYPQAPYYNAPRYYY